MSDIGQKAKTSDCHEQTDPRLKRLFNTSGYDRRAPFSAA
jgi:hypothetical protein